MMLFGTLSDTCLDWEGTMTNERYVFTETVTRTVEAEGEDNVERLQAFVEKQGLPTNPLRKAPSTERPEAPEARTRESAVP